MSTLITAPVIAETPANDPLHVWIGNPDPAGVTAWVQRHLDDVARLEKQILEVQGARTVENTLAPFDEMGRALSTASMGPSLLNNASPVKELRDVAQTELRRVSSVGAEISLNRKLYDALVAIKTDGLDSETKHYLERELQGYRLAGVDKNEATRAKIRDLRDKLTTVALQFNRNIAEGTASIKVKASELDGLPADYIARHQPDEHGMVTITTDEPDYRPVITYAKSAALRKQLYLTYMGRCYPANKDLLLQLIAMREEISQLIGMKSWAELSSADKMIGTPGNIQSLIDELDKAARPAMDKEYAQLLAFAQKQEPGLTQIPDYSASYFGELFRRDHFNFDSQAVRAYFPYEEVEKGVLDTAARMFHIEFVQVKDAALWDPSVKAFDVFDRSTPDRQKIGIIYLDMHPRVGKNKWFNAGTVVQGKKEIALPEARLNANFPEPTATDPGLMQYADVVTFFHEFGHMLHGIFGNRQQWAGTGAFSIEWDFVEAPSQMLEEFFASKAVLDTFAKHYKTGELMPQSLFDNMIRADEFGRGIAVERQLQFCTYALDMFHLPAKDVDVDKFWYASQAKYSPYAATPDVRMYATFTHLVSYSSNYYTYQLSKVIALDFFGQFDPKNLLDGPAAMRYRKTILEAGGTASANTLVKNFLGRPQQYEATKKWINAEFAK